ncbi:outer membrane protein [Tsuneonella sp. SYSU-LHT278]|uniref:outer membrane protein n=1 Tax=Tsuneonella sediminis TaxID=3416089 RepID=UPI003F7993DA
MRFMVMVAAAAATVAAVASPAAANETRLEVRGGIVWCCGVSDETIGVAIGHDFDVGTGAFIGVEGVADTNFDFVDPTLGVNARVGAKVGETGKVFGTLGYAYETGFDIDDWVLGAGYQTDLGANALVSLQYQRYMDTDINRAIVGVGFRF